MKNYFKLSLLAGIALSLFACSDFQEGEANVEFKVEPTDVALEANQSEFTINVSCSDTWNVRDLPDWITLNKVSPVKDWAFTWELLFKCDESEFDRTGLFFVVDAKNANYRVNVEQRGQRGPEVRVQSLSLIPEMLILQKGEEAVITATVLPDDASNPALNWTVSDEQIISFSPEDCKVFALAPGAASIIATTVDGGFTAECKIKVEQHASSVSLVFADTEAKAEAFEMELNDYKPVQLKAVVLPEDAEDKTVEWHSTDESVVRVSGGLVTAIGVGEADVYATTVYGGLSSGNCHVTVVCKVTGVTLKTKSLSLKVGETRQLTAEVTPANAGNKKIIWESSDATIATVDQSGQVTAVATGSAEIKVTTEDGGYFVTCAVTVEKNVIHVESVTLSRSSLELVQGNSAVIEARVLPENATNRSLTWVISDLSVATVSEDGTVTAMAVGSAVVTATSVENPSVSASCTVTVKTAQPEAVDLGLSVKWASWNVGASAPEDYGDYFAWGETAPKSNYSWSSYKFELGTDFNGPFSKYVTNSSYGAVDNKTVLDPKDDAALVNWGDSWRMPTKAEQDELRNNCTWTWITQNGVNGRLVTGPNGNSIFLPASGGRYDTHLYDASSYGLYWSSSLSTDGPDRAWYVNFDSDGVYRYRSNRCYGFSVRPVCGAFVAVSSISLNRSSVNLDIGGTSQLTATLSPSNATEKTIHWVTSNSNIATVSENGLVTAKAAGTTTITAYASNGKSATCAVTVAKPVVHVTSVTLSQTSLELTPGKSTTLTAIVSPSNADNKYLTWSSSNSYVATVSQIGTVTAKAVGSAVITATSDDNPSITATCTVTVKTAQPEAVDLGLSVKWASWNVGASAPEEYGDYFAWGETEQIINDKSYYSFNIKYGKTQLDLENDAAYANWGNNWRMPTEAEWAKLLSNCTWTWISNYNDTEVSGCLIRSNVPGYTNQSIFLPAAGLRNGISILNEGGAGYYWSSSLYQKGNVNYDNKAWRIYISSSDVNRNNLECYLGCSVRPVTE